MALLMFAAGFALGLFFGWLLHRERVERAVYEDAVHHRDRAVSALAETASQLELADEDLIGLRAQLGDARRRLDERDARIVDLEASAARQQAERLRADREAARIDRRSTAGDAAGGAVAVTAGTVTRPVDVGRDDDEPAGVVARDAERSGSQAATAGADSGADSAAAPPPPSGPEAVRPRPVDPEAGRPLPVAMETGGPPSDAEARRPLRVDPEVGRTPSGAEAGRTPPGPEAGRPPSTGEAAERPPSAAHRQAPDELRRLSGVGPVLERALHAEGITTFRQLAALDDAAIADLGTRHPQLVARLRRDAWVEQARRLIAETAPDDAG